MAKIVHAGQSDRGRMRRNNEDRWLTDGSMGLFAVADGLGGAAGGELAAQMVIDSLPGCLRRHLRLIGNLADSRVSERVVAALMELNALVRTESQKHPMFKGMGATLVLALARDWQALIAHLGDSRAYRCRQGALELLTRDHTPLQRLLERGELTAEQARRHPSAGLLSRYVGMKVEASPDLRIVEMQPGDQLLLCSDGLYEMLSEAQMADILTHAATPREACQQLIDTANAAGGHDNITAVVAAWS
jgi:protein phosphatase